MYDRMQSTGVTGKIISIFENNFSFEIFKCLPKTFYLFLQEVEKSYNQANWLAQG
jgi:hypothetical protein